MFRERARKARESPRTSLGRTGQGRGKSVAKEKSRQWLKFKPSGNLPCTAIKLEHAKPSLAQECARGIANWIKRKKHIRSFRKSPHSCAMILHQFSSFHPGFHGELLSFTSPGFLCSSAQVQGLFLRQLGGSFSQPQVVHWYFSIFKNWYRMQNNYLKNEIRGYLCLFILLHLNQQTGTFYEQMCFLGSPTKTFPTSQLHKRTAAHFSPVKEGGGFELTYLYWLGWMIFEYIYIHIYNMMISGS